MNEEIRYSYTISYPLASTAGLKYREKSYDGSYTIRGSGVTGQGQSRGWEEGTTTLLRKDCTRSAEGPVGLAKQWSGKTPRQRILGEVTVPGGRYI